MTTNNYISRLKREAKRLSKEEQIPHHEALNRIAIRNGYESWNLLVRQNAKLVNIDGLPDSTNHGDIVLLAGRPHNGKTQQAIRMLSDAMNKGWQGAFFTLDYTITDFARVSALAGVDFGILENRLSFYDSDDICADYITHRLANTTRKTMIVVDYLQMLDHRRTNAPIGDQLEVLKTFCRGTGAIMIMLSQIDRRFGMSGKPTPNLADIRQPNPIDLSLFDHMIFSVEGELIAA